MLLIVIHTITSSESVFRTDFICIIYAEMYLQLGFDGGAPPEHAWRRRLNSHANILKEFSITFKEAVKMVC